MPRTCFALNDVENEAVKHVHWDGLDDFQPSLATLQAMQMSRMHEQNSYAACLLALNKRIIDLSLSEAIFSKVIALNEKYAQIYKTDEGCVAKAAQST